MPETVADLLSELLDCFAYEQGSIKSGVHNVDRLKQLRQSLKAAAKSPTYRTEEAYWFRERFLSDEAVKQHHGVEDVAAFWNWLWG